MKFLAVFFLVGLGLASANPVSSDQKLSLDHVEELDYLLSSLALEEGDNQDTKEKIIEKLREHIKDILEMIKESVKNGIKIKEETLERLQQYRDKLKEMHGDLSEHLLKLYEEVKEHFINKIKEGAGNLWNRLLEKINNIFGNKDSRRLRRDLKETIIEKTKELVKELMEKVTNGIEQGKDTVQNFVKQVITALKVLKEFKIDVSQLLKESMSKLSKDVYQKIKDMFKHNDYDLDESIVMSHADQKNEAYKEKIKGYLEQIMKFLADGKLMARMMAETIATTMVAVANGSTEFAKMALDMTQDLIKNLPVTVTDAVKNFFESLKERLDRIVKGNGEIEKRSIKDAFEKFKEFISGIGFNLKGKFLKLGEYFKDLYNEGFKFGTDKYENFKMLTKELARQIREAAEGATAHFKEVAAQLLEVVNESKGELGQHFKDLHEELSKLIKG